ncbi:MAG: thiamine diphosphokinase [Microthrixaceae bacterium]
MVVIVVAGGSGPSSLPPLPPDVGLCVAADSGLELAVTLGLHVDVVLGDLDSVEGATLEAARRRGVEVRRFPAAKDQTDLELALDAAARAGAQRIVVLGGGGGRLDHLLGAMASLAGVAREGIDVVGHLGDATLWLVGGGRRLVVDLDAGRTASLIALGGPAEGVSTGGLEWPLEVARLSPDEARGVSNRVSSRVAAEPGRRPVVVEVRSGVVALIVPGVPLVPGASPLGPYHFEAAQPGPTRSTPMGVPT